MLKLVRHGARVGWLSVVCGCSSFTGSTIRPLDADSPEVTEVAVDVAVEVAVRDAPSADAPPLVCGALDGACDPFTDRGCAAGTRCQVTTLLPPTFVCAPVGPRRLGQSCDPREKSGACVAGLQCLSERCLAPCCAGDDARCLALSASSTCAVLTDSTRLLGCTIPGECSYRPTDSCGASAQCYPQSEYGETVCLTYGTSGLDGRCEDTNACARGLTCVLPSAAVGRCRPVCNLRGEPRCATGRCRAFNRRPVDYGYCEG